MMNLINEILKNNGVNLQVSREVESTTYKLSDDFSESFSMFDFSYNALDIQLLVEETEEEVVAKGVYVMRNGEFYKIFA